MARIVVGVDDSRGGRAALAWAVEEAALRHAALEVVHAWTLPLWEGWNSEWPADDDWFRDDARRAGGQTDRGMRRRGFGGRDDSLYRSDAKDRRSVCSNGPDLLTCSSSDPVAGADSRGCSWVR